MWDDGPEGYDPADRVLLHAIRQLPDTMPLSPAFHQRVIAVAQRRTQRHRSPADVYMRVAELSLNAAAVAQAGWRTLPAIALTVEATARQVVSPFTMVAAYAAVMGPIHARAV
ncbi:MAG: hypothetical protein V3S24_24290 [Candidatus Tectomicrobia bacterium]